MADLFGRFLVQNWHVPYFLFHRFVFRDTFSIRIGSPLLCRTCFHIKLLKRFWKAQLSLVLRRAQNKNYTSEL